MVSETTRLDYTIIAGIIEPGSRVLDLGCGDGELIDYLSRAKDVKVQGIELNEDAIYRCVEKGLSVYHSDIDGGLAGYPDGAFDYIILNQSLQETKKVKYVIGESLRAARKVIVGFPNFAHYRARLRLFFKGKVPITRTLPYTWYDTPNLHFLSATDFADFCARENIAILNAYYLGEKSTLMFLPNLFAVNAIFVITKK